jgi:hypothetical protein
MITPHTLLFTVKVDCIFGTDYSPKEIVAVSEVCNHALLQELHNLPICTNWLMLT